MKDDDGGRVGVSHGVLKPCTSIVTPCTCDGEYTLIKRINDDRRIVKYPIGIVITIDLSAKRATASAAAYPRRDRLVQ